MINCQTDNTTRTPAIFEMSGFCMKPANRPTEYHIHSFGHEYSDLQENRRQVQAVIIPIFRFRYQVKGFLWNTST